MNTEVYNAFASAEKVIPFNNSDAVIFFFPGNCKLFNSKNDIF